MEVVKISKTGRLLCIQEISDQYREVLFPWIDDEESFSV